MYRSSSISSGQHEIWRGKVKKYTSYRYVFYTLTFLFGSLLIAHFLQKLQRILNSEHFNLNAPERFYFLYKEREEKKKDDEERST